MRRTTFALLTLLISAAFPLSAEATRTPAPSDRYPRFDVILAASLATAYGTSVLLQDDLAAPTCRWCAPPAFDASVRTRLLSADPLAARRASDIVAMGAIPMLTIGGTLLGSERGEIPFQLLRLTESTLLALTLNQGVKLAVGRERPFVHALADEDKRLTDHPSDNNLSFYSGHSTLAFCLVATASELARIDEMPHAYLIPTFGYPLALSVAWLRVAGDKHYASDVAVGAAIGYGIGRFFTSWRHDVRPPSISGTPLARRIIVAPSVSPHPGAQAIIYF